MKGIKKLIIIISLVLVSALVFSGCACPIFSMLEKSTGLRFEIGDNIDESVVADELIYPGSTALVQAYGNVEKVIDLVSKYGVSFSDEEMQALESLPEEVAGQEIGALVYSAPDGRQEVLSYYEGLTGNGWDIESLGTPGSDMQDSAIIIAAKGDRQQALMITGSDNSAFILFIDIDWDIFMGHDGEQD